MFRNYIPTFFTTKNPFFMNYGFNSIMNFIWLMTQITFFQSFSTFLYILDENKLDLKYSRKKNRIVSLY